MDIRHARSAIDTSFFSRHFFPQLFVSLQRQTLRQFAIGLLLIVWMPVSLAALPWLNEANGRPTLAPMLQQVTPAVVNISTKSRVSIRQNPLFNDPFFRRFFDMPDIPQQQERQALGSGVIVDADKGYVLTNNHVIANADEITVTLRDKRQFEAKVVGTDPDADLAVIRIDAEELRQLDMADSSTLQVRDFVVAIGNPCWVLRDMRILFRPTLLLIPATPAVRWWIWMANWWALTPPFLVPAAAMWALVLPFPAIWQRASWSSLSNMVKYVVDSWG